jgi:hypothetical protein
MEEINKEEISKNCEIKTTEIREESSKCKQVLKKENSDQKLLDLLELKF